MLAEVKFPGIEEMVQWPAAFFKDTPFAFNKVALLSLDRRRHPDHLVPRGRCEGQEVARAVRRAEHRRDLDRVRREAGHRPGHRRRRHALPAAAAVDVPLHLLRQPLRGHPDVPLAGQRPHGQPGPAGAARLAGVHRRRCQAPRPRLLQGSALPAGRAQGALPAGDADRVHLDLPRAALLPRRPSLRQHAGRPHPARDLLRC